MFEFMPVWDSASKEPLYMQLYRFLKLEIQCGRIKAGARLPSKRKLAVHLGISKNTIEAAYQQLDAEGYVDCQPRKGIFVKEMEEGIYPGRVKKPVRPISRTEEYKIDFSHGRVDVSHFPFSKWRRLNQQLQFQDEGDYLHVGHPQGELPLREEIAEYLFQSRGVICSSEQIIIGARIQYLLGMLHVTLGKECLYAMENPGFHRVRTTLEGHGLIVESIPLDEQGIRIQPLYDKCVDVVYVTPSHQFPTGTIMPISRRNELLRWADRTKGYIIEDDYDSEFRYAGKPIPALQGLNETERVIYLGTFSKSFIPSIRLSYMVLPGHLMEEYQTRLNMYKQTVSRITQVALAAFMKEGDWNRHLNRMRNVYRRKQKILITAINRHMGDRVTIIGEKSGLHILLQVHSGQSESCLIELAKGRSIKIYPTSIYHTGGGRGNPAVLLGFGGLSEEEIETGIRGLAEIWFG